MAELRRSNNFDALRLLGALLVAMGHCLFLFSSDAYITSVLVQSLGALGLYMFCIISGYLITQSRMRNSRPDFALARALRIVPALLLALPLMALVIGPFVTALPKAVYFTTGETWRFLASIFIFPLNPTLPGVFNSSGVIGQLYTLTEEVAFYALVCAFGTWKRYPVLLGVLLTGTAAFLIHTNYTTLSFGSNYVAHIGPMTTFVFPARTGTYCIFYLLMGSAVFTSGLPRRLLTQVLPALLVVWLVALVSSDRRAYDMIEMAFLPVIVIGIGLYDRAVLRIPAWIGDMSYGIYIYHFFVAELVLFVAGPDWPKAFGITASMLFAMLAGWLSFHLVEKRALALKPVRSREAVKDVSVAAEAAEHVREGA